jgi:hypothetical protein
MKPIKFTRILPVLLMCFLFGNVYGQTQAVSSQLKATFCGKKESGKDSDITTEELSQCNWKIVLSDTSYTISSFKMSLVPVDYKKGTYQEYEMRGDSIGEKYRSDVLKSQRIILEFIKASNKWGDSKLLNPIGLTIKDSRKIYPK